MSEAALIATLFSKFAELVALAIKGDPQARARVESILPDGDPLRLEVAQLESRAEARARFGESP
jgi:hypothetical protein